MRVPAGQPTSNMSLLADAAAMEQRRLLSADLPG